MSSAQKSANVEYIALVSPHNIISLIDSMGPRTLNVKLPDNYYHEDGCINFEMTDKCPVVSAFRHAASELSMRVYLNTKGAP